MGSICFSTVSILRCKSESISHLQAVLLIIPTALEVMFSTSLIFTIRGTSRRHLWLTAEGWIYFALALVEMLTHILPAVRDGAQIFKVLDRVLAATSFVPVLFYILFIFLFTRAELITALPGRWQTITKLLFLISIPTIVAFNQVASFVGVSYDPKPRGLESIMVVGFRNVKGQTLWIFFTSLTLALLTAFQAIGFSLTFYRIIKVIVDKRRIETTSSDESHLLKGIGWIAGGLKLGAIETVVGFAANEFGSVMTRRILRFLARACLCIGLIKGLDSTEDFKDLGNELLGTGRTKVRRSGLREFISNPRFSTFQQLTPTATAFHSAPRAQVIGRPSPLSGIGGGSTDMKELTEIKQATNFPPPSANNPQQRVTVYYENGTPRLHLRLSVLEIPMPPMPVYSPLSAEPPLIFKSDVISRPATAHPTPSNNPSILSELVISESGQGISNIGVLHQGDPVPTNLARIGSLHSTRSIAESYTSLSMVREIASQFPPLPVRTPMPVNNPPSIKRVFKDFWDDTVSIDSQSPTAPESPSAPKPPPGFDVDPPATGNSPSIHISVLPDQPIHTPTGPSSAALSASTPTFAEYLSTPALSRSADDPDSAYLDLGSALDTKGSRAFMRESTGVTPHPADWIDYSVFPKTSQGLPMVMEEGKARSHATITRPTRKRFRRSGNCSIVKALAVPWLENNPGMEEEERRSLARALCRRPQPSRIKSAPMRSTPRPVKARRAHNSVLIERIMIPPKQNSNVEIVQGSPDSASNHRILRDAEVVQIESGGYSAEMHRRGHF